VKVEQSTHVLTFYFVKTTINYVTSYELMAEEEVPPVGMSNEINFKVWIQNPSKSFIWWMNNPSLGLGLILILG